MRFALALALRCSLSVTLTVGRAPDPAFDLDGLAGGREGAQPVVDPSLAHAGRCYEVGHRNAFLWGGGQDGPQHRVRVIVAVGRLWSGPGCLRAVRGAGGRAAVQG